MSALSGGRYGAPKNGLGEGEKEGDIHTSIPSSAPGVNTPAQYQHFNSPIYPRIGRGFPRRYVDTTPDEILYDPDRILSRGIAARLIHTGQTELYQPRVESEAMTEIQPADCTPSQAPFQCPPPFSQLPVIKQQIHIEPSRDAEIFYAPGCVDVPASPDGVTPGTATVMTFDTFNNLRTIIKWTQMIVYDALCPSQVTVEIRVDGQPIKWTANPMGSIVGSGGIVYTTVTTRNSQDFSDLPDCCRNTLIEITDRRHVEVFASNLAMVDRRVMVSLWGWIESITMWDQAVKH